MSWEVPSMPSKKLSFNTTLFRKNLARFWPLWGGVSLLSALMPLTLLMSFLNPYFSGDVTTTNVTQALYTVAAGLMPVASLFYAVLAAMAVWSWLYTARSAGFMHTLPMDRGTIFLTSAASGLAILLIPYVVTGGLTCLILLCFGVFPPLAVLQTISAALGYTLFYFASATFAAMVTSNLFAMPVFYFIGHFFAVILQTLLEWFAGSLIFGYAGSDELSLTFLSPTVAFYRYMEINSTHLEDGSREIAFHGLWIIWAYAAVGLVLLALSFWLYRLRHSESAGEVVAYRPLKPIFRYGVALCFALTLGMMLYEIIWNSNLSAGLYSEVVPLSVCMILAGLMGYYAASMLLAKSHKVFKGSGRGVAVTAALVIVLCAGVYFDILGLGSRVPDAADVQRVYLHIDGEAVSVEAGDPRVEEIIALQRAIMDSEDEVRAFNGRSDWRYGHSGEETSISTLHIDYDLKNGTLTRSYHIPLFRERWDREPNSYEGRINRLINSPETALAQVESPKDGALVHISVWADSSATDTDGPMKDAIYAAIRADAAAGRLPGYSPFYDERKQTVYLDAVINLEFRYTWTNAYTGEPEVDYLYRDVQVTTAMTATLQALLDTGILSAEQLQTMLPEEALGAITIPEAAQPAGSFDSVVFVMP